MPKHTHILNAASNLLGIAFVIIAGLNVTGLTGKTLADEVAWAAAVLLSLSCLLSYLAIRSEPNGARAEAGADLVFMLGLAALFAAVVVLAVTGV
jgi:hypothetical protein